MIHKRNKPHAFFFSVLTALASGMAVAFILISGSRFVVNRVAADFFPKSFLAQSITGTITGANSDPIAGTNIPGQPVFFPSSASPTGSVSQTTAKAVLPPPATSAYSIPSDEVIENVQDILPPGVTKKPITAASYIVTNMDTGKVLLEKDADDPFPIASMTKLVTAVIAEKFMNQSRQITITSSILATEGNTAHFRLGEKFKVSELYYPLLMVSSNDAAEALAQNYGRAEFIGQMNTWVHSIGATQTNFADPSGLSADNVSTARDISTIVGWIEKHMPSIFAITATKTKTIRVHTWVNPTSFLNFSAYVGGKNGYTPEASSTGTSLFKLGDPPHTYSTVVLGSQDRDDETLDILDKALK